MGTRGYIATAILAGCTFDANVDGSGMTLGDDSGSTSSPSTSAGASTSSTSGGSTSTTTTTKGETTGDGDSSSTGDPSEGTGSSSTSSGGAGICPDLLWVTGELDIAATDDAAFYQAVIDLDYDVEAVTGTDATPEMAEGKCAVLLSSNGDSTLVNTKFQQVTVPVLVWEHGLFDDMGMVMTAANQATTASDSIDIIMDGHPLAIGLSGRVALQGAVDQMAWGHAGDNVVATIAGVPSQHAVFFYEAGDTMPSAIVAPALRVALPFANESNSTWNEAAVDLFVAAVEFTTQG